MLRRDYWKTMNDGMFRDFRPFYERTVLPFLIERENPRIVELGVNEGISGIFLAESMLNAGKNDFKIYFVDDLSYGGRDQWNDILTHIRQSGLSGDIVEAWCMDSIQASYGFGDNSLDFVWIDSSHEYEHTKEEIRKWKPKLKSGGMLAGHDYHNVKRRVGEAVNELIPRDRLNTQPGIDGYGSWWTKVE